MEQTFYYLRNHPEATALSPLEVELTIRVAEAVITAGGRALVVGGYARDLALGQAPKDVDIEVYGLEVETLENLLKPIHHVDQVGAAFGVLKVGPLDVSLPRRDSKSGSGHRGFVIEADPLLTYTEASRRRDFTINAMALDPLNGEVFDEYGGLSDIQTKLLRAVDARTFAEDPLRGLRAMQFAGRFGFSVDEGTAELIKSLDLSELSDERIGEEWTKLLLKSEQPSFGLDVARELEIIQRLHSELAALISTPQEPEWHPEGSVWNHTLLALDVAAWIIRREGLEHDRALTVMLATLCHDLGKPATTVVSGGRIRSPEHAKMGVEPAHTFMKRLCVPQKIGKKVERLVFDHMFMLEIEHAKDATIRRLAKRLAPATIQELIWVTEADFYGRGIQYTDRSPLDLFQKRAEELAVDTAPLEPLVKGRDLIELGVKPGKEMGQILKWLEQAQIEGAFGTREEGLKYYKNHFLFTESGTSSTLQ